jgi:cellulose synthase/poly-beta-1,6-N-acetylglucosamine synthase-like glycosyltransferase
LIAERRTIRLLAASTAPSAPWTLPWLGGALLVLGGVLGTGRLLTLLTIALQLLFFVFFVRHLTFVLAATRAGRADQTAPFVDSGFRPAVSVLVACRNEESVVQGLVQTLLRLDYPADRLQLIIVDDGSSDRTGELLDMVARREPRLRCLHRPPGAGGGKSGALNDALKLVTGAVVVVFDADHQPHPDVLRRLVRHFEDPVVGAVQGRCQIRNSDGVLLTELIAIDYLAGYLVNEYGRQSMFELPAYGGANCAVRTDSLRAIGGWNPRTVTEDTDLTLRLMLAGQRIRYDVTAVDEEEGVTSLARYWRQRYRWARGHQQVWRDYRRAVWRSPRLSPGEKIELTMFLLVFHLPVASAIGLLLLIAWQSGAVAIPPPVDTYTFAFWPLLFLGPLLELSSGLMIARADRRKAFVLRYFLPLFFVSIALCTKAWVDGLLGRPYTWVKTPRARDRPGGAVAPRRGRLAG